MFHLVTRFVKRLSKFLFSRAFLFSFLVLSQFGLLFYFVFTITELSLPIYFLMYAINLLFVAYLFRSDTNPMYKLTWVVVILAIPIFGGVIYFVIGVQRMDKKMLREYERIRATSKKYALSNDELARSLAHEHPHLFRQSQYITKAASQPVYSDTVSTYFPTGERYFEALVQELKKAKKFIFLEYFIIREGIMWNDILAILTEKVRENVEVRLIYDDIGCLFTLPKDYWIQMNQLGIHTVVFNPLRLRMSVFINNRDHRKICVIDGKVAFTGGINLADEYINEELRFGHWKDTGVMIKGEGVRSFTLMFLEMWHFANRSEPNDFMVYLPTSTGVIAKKGELVQPYADDPLDEKNVAEYTYLNMINQANRYLYITTPYLILDNELITALSLAASSGVDVRIVTPGIPDKKMVFYLTQSYYSILIRNGVKIYQYKPGFVHAKMFVSDDEVASVGTINLDFRSLYLHFECGCVFYHSPVVYDVKNDIIQLFDDCELVTESMLHATALWKRLLQSFLRVIAPLM